ncbi:hypothetical protein KN10_0162 [Anoxybacillus flavithermus NBRC 109594]|uniref:Uncharacterized protein n=1 Tax=Anoxybacillus flavithermus NBRC 109594 TaxID=1315967 RepID=R4F8Q2_9BACL|nr:hypothetical protein KN10_0162 [Anoxybacillus flavithermus NBRC 109594]
MRRVTSCYPLLLIMISLFFLSSMYYNKKCNEYFQKYEKKAF